MTASSIRNMVDKLKRFPLTQELGQDVEALGSKIKDLSRQIEGSGKSLVDLGSLVAAIFFSFDVLEFKLKAISLNDDLDTDPSSHSIDTLLETLESKYLSLFTQGLWSPVRSKNSAGSSSG